MTTVLAQWRASYTPGAWIVLAGPSSLVVLQPSANGWTPLLDTIWEAVLASDSLVDLADRLAGHGIGRMPSFGAFFWAPDGMRSMVRGDVVVQDASTGSTVASGDGIHTWSESGLSGVDRIVVRTGPGPDSFGDELPLVVGVAYASSVTLDAGPFARVQSAQGWPEAAGLEAESAFDPGPANDLWIMENGSTEQMSLGAPADGTDEEDTAEPTEPMQDLDELPVATLVLSDGHRVSLTGRVRIGRAPSAAAEEPDLLLVTVLSPNQDISRSHVQVEPRDGQVVVTDLRSTNGTILVRPGPRAPERLAPDVALAVPVGSVLELGDGVQVSIEPAHPFS